MQCVSLHAKFYFIFFQLYLYLVIIYYTILSCSLCLPLVFLYFFMYRFTRFVFLDINTSIFTNNKKVHISKGVISSGHEREMSSSLLSPHFYCFGLILFASI